MAGALVALVITAGITLGLGQGLRILVDQGLDDKFLEPQLQPDRFETACAEADQPLELRRHAGYDHGYYFIATFIEDHLRHHATHLA